VGKAWLLLAAILLTFAVTLIGVMVVASLLAHASSRRVSRDQCSGVVTNAS
jgi:hypothetical protein